jgi:hypothetical protein
MRKIIFVLPPLAVSYSRGALSIVFKRFSEGNEIDIIIPNNESSFLPLTIIYIIYHKLNYFKKAGEFL